MNTKRYHQAALASCVVPWGEREDFLEGVFRREVRHLLAAGFRDIYIFGTAGEGYAVNRPDFEQIVTVFREETLGEGVFPQVGVIGLSTVQMLMRLEYAYRAGFRVFQISLPGWGALNDAEVLRFFRDVCGAFPDSQFLHYNLARAKRVLTPGEYRKLQAEIPNLVATKNTAPNVFQTIDLVRQAGELQHFVGEATFPIGCMQGECSLLSSFGPVIPGPTFRLFRHVVAGEWEQAFLLHKEYMAAMCDVLAPMMRTGVWMDGAYDKVLARLGGMEMPLRLLSPYSSFSEEVVAECRNVLVTQYAHLLE
ncbi:MAG: dihydrodipicolinate synthase family protein [Acidobacteria bacterium]|nr:dihydrodipicolinate synthase family protein [Acidobacteriota bacterium]